MSSGEDHDRGASFAIASSKSADVIFAGFVDGRLFQIIVGFTPSAFQDVKHPISYILLCMSGLLGSGEVLKEEKVVRWNLGDIQRRVEVKGTDGSGLLIVTTDTNLEKSAAKLLAQHMEKSRSSVSPAFGVDLKHSATFSDIFRGRGRPINEAIATELLGYTDLRKLKSVPSSLIGPIYVLGITINGKTKVSESSHGTYGGHIEPDRIGLGDTDETTFDVSGVYSANKRLDSGAIVPAILLVCDDALFEMVENNREFTGARSLWMYMNTTGKADIWLVR